MPHSAKKPCSYPNCHALVASGSRCEQHQHRVDNRESAAKRGYDYRWRRLRRMYLNRHPVCSDIHGIHARRGEVAVATEVDHIMPLSQGGTNAWNNLQALCKSCHSIKTAREG